MLLDGALDESKKPQVAVGTSRRQHRLMGQHHTKSIRASVGKHPNQWTKLQGWWPTNNYGAQPSSLAGSDRALYLQALYGCGVPVINFFNLWDFSE